MLKLRNRVVFLYAILCLLTTAMVVRLGYIHIVWAPELEAYAKNQQNKEIPILAKRGDIVDRKGDKLAFSVSTYTIWAHAAGISKPQETAKLLAETIDVDEKTITDTILEKKAAYVKVAKGLSKTDADLVRSKGIRGISVEEEVKRVYPYGQLASRVIGKVNAANVGHMGLEMFYNETLTGIPGLAKITTDVYGRQLANGMESITPPENGLDMMLTIDNTIQYFVEERLKETYEKYTPISASAIVMDPNSGEILAMGKYPTFDLNEITKPIGTKATEDLEKTPVEEQKEFIDQLWKNTMVEDIYEPGSVMKLFTLAVALEEGAVSMNDHFYCKGYIMVGSEVVNCVDRDKGGHGDQSVYQALANSCNPAFVQMIQRIKPESYFKYFDKLGIPGKTGVDLPSETNGLLSNRENLQPRSYVSMSYGHGMSLSMVQVASVISTLINGGDMVQPHVVKSFLKDGETVDTIVPTVKENIFSDATVKKIRELMTYVVDKKYTKSVKLKGIQIGAKTGTSVKIVDGGYSDDHVLSSFVGVFPMEAPEYLVYVVIDEPNVNVQEVPVSSLLGRSIIDDILRYKNIVPDDEEKKQVKLPKLSGKTLKEAKIELEKLKLNVSTDPLELEENITYIVKDQFPRENEVVDEGSTIILSVSEE